MTVGAFVIIVNVAEILVYNALAPDPLRSLIEVGVLIEDASFASYLAGQWLGLIEAGLVGEYKVG